MTGSTDSNWVRIAGYVIVAMLTVAARRRERSRAASVDGVWPPFWSLTGGFLIVMAFGRAGDIGDLLADFGRDEAVTSGWYAARRPIQAAVVVVLGLGWLVVVGLACWRTPERRRRYLPTSLAVITIAAFAAIRIVSLHQVDTVLHRTHIGSVRVGTLTELGLLLIAAVVSFWIPGHRAASPDLIVVRDPAVVEL